MKKRKLVEMGRGPSKEHYWIQDVRIPGFSPPGKVPLPVNKFTHAHFLSKACEFIFYRRVRIKKVITQRKLTHLFIFEFYVKIAQKKMKLENLFKSLYFFCSELPNCSVLFGV